MPAGITVMMTETSNIKMIIFDVDGVLTDGTILIDDHGVETKRFHVRDGMAIRMAQQMGLKVAALTSRTTRAVSLRLGELGVDPVLQGATDKAVGLETICRETGVLPEQCAYVGDDLLDLPALLRCGLPVAVADAVEEVKAEAKHVTAAPGGHGAAREVIEHILKAQGRWDEMLKRYGV